MNQISYNDNSSFPSQVVPDAEKATLEYGLAVGNAIDCLLYTSPSPRDKRQSRMPSSA